MIFHTDNIDKYISKMGHDHYSRRVKSHYQAYGGKYDFCRFFVIGNDEYSSGIIVLFNSSMIVTVLDNVTLLQTELEEVVTFIKMKKPLSCELEKQYAKQVLSLLDEYNGDERTKFRFCSRNDFHELDVDEIPRLQAVYDVLSSSFPAIAQSYELWMTDTSHRIRRGLSQSFLLGDYSTATIQYIVEKTVLVGHVATIPAERGKLHARKLLYWIGEKLSRDGFEVILFARPNRVSYYKEIGFEAEEVDIVLERINENE